MQSSVQFWYMQSLLILNENRWDKLKLVGLSLSEDWNWWAEPVSPRHTACKLLKYQYIEVHRDKVKNQPSWASKWLWALFQRISIKKCPSQTLTLPYVSRGSQARLLTGEHWTLWSLTASGSLKGLSVKKKGAQGETMICNLPQPVGCWGHRLYLSCGKNGLGELQQALDLDLHCGQRALADCKWL